jgi:hypothetical protein
MNRFQFRIWNNVGKEYTNTDLAYVLSSPIIFQDYIVQQCLGVTDKNNRLIYEGDVVKFTAQEYNDPEIGVVTNLIPAIGEIIYCSNYCAFRIKQIQQGKYKDENDYLPELGMYNYTVEWKLNFYCPHEGTEEFNWKELEIVGSIADEYFISLSNEVSKLTIPEELIKLIEDRTA